jgi:multiple sugar transport system substrate-binding protein
MDNDQTVFQSSKAANNPKVQDQNTLLSSFAPPSSPLPATPNRVPQSVLPQVPQSAPELPFQQTPQAVLEPTPQPVSEPVFQQAAPQLISQDILSSREPIAEMPTLQKPLPNESSVGDLINQESPISQGFQDAQQPSNMPPPPPSEVTPGLANDDFGGNKFATVKKIAKLLIGLFVVIVVFMLVFTVVVPILTKSSNKTTLTYWGLWEDSNVMQGIISDFERQNPNVVINYSKQDIKQYRERLVTRIANGNGPDIFRFHNSWVSMLSGSLLALPSDTISKVEFNQDFYPVVQKDLIKNGAIYGIPLEIDTLALFINNQLFQSAGLQPPTNWDDLVNDARVMTVKDKDSKIKTAGVALGTYSNVSHAPDIISLLLAQNGVDLNSLQNASGRAASALTFYTSFATDQNNVWDSTLDPSIAVFSRGDLAMYFGYSWDYFTIKQANPNLSFQIVPVPQLSDHHVTMASYWAEGVSSRSKHPKEALAFMKFLAAKSTEEKLYADEAKVRGFGEPYARVDLADTLKTNTIIYPAVYQAPDATSSFFVDNTYDAGLNQQSNTYLGNAINSILSGTSPQSAFDTLSQGVSQVLQKYGQ